MPLPPWQTPRQLLTGSYTHQFGFSDGSTDEKYCATPFSSSAFRSVVRCSGVITSWHQSYTSAVPRLRSDDTRSAPRLKSCPVIHWSRAAVANASSMARWAYWTSPLTTYMNASNPQLPCITRESKDGAALRRALARLKSRARRSATSGASMRARISGISSAEKNRNGCSPAGGSITETRASAVCPPSAVVTVIVALPALTAVTSPVASTVATDGSLELQDTCLLLAFGGETVASRRAVWPSSIDQFVGDTLTPSAGTSPPDAGTTKRMSS